MLAETLVLTFFLLMVFAIGLAKHQDARTENVTEHPIRQGILNVLRKMPGANLVEVCRRLDSHRGTVSHHMYLLERSDHVSSLPQGRERRFFIKDEYDGTRSKISLLRQKRARTLVRLIMENPGIVQKDLARRAELTRKVLRRYVDLLAAEDLLREVPRSRTRRYFPTATLHEVLPMIDASAEPLRHGGEPGTTRPGGSP